MESNTITFVETNVCDGSAFNLKWGTLILYPGGFVFNYNRTRKETKRTQDVIKLSDILEVKFEKIDWLVSKIFWVGRSLVKIRTKEGEKRYYLKHKNNLYTALKLLQPDLEIIKK
jgi:hypothetical protein